MKKLLLPLLAIAVSSVINAQSIFEKEPYLTQSLVKETISNVEVKTSGGSIRVSGVSSSEAKIEMYVIPNNSLTISKDELKQRLEENYVIDIKVSNGKLTATAKQKNQNWNWKKSVSISFRVYVPQNVNTDLNTSGGSIHLSTLTGSQKFTTSGGSLHVEGITGQIDGSTSGGSIEVSNSKSDIDLRTSGGSIDASNCSGTMNLKTSGGSLHLDNLDGKIDAGTSGGSVHAESIKGELTASTSGGSMNLTDMRCSLDASTNGGSIEAEITEVGAYVKLDNSAGNIDVTLPAGKGYNIDLRGNKVKTNNLNNFRGETVSEDRVKGTLNGGGVPVELNASSGKVTVTFKQ